MPIIGADDEMYELVPTDVWHYGQAGAVEGGVCIFSNLFNNGFVIQVLEKDEEILSFIIDFGQVLFDESKFYPFILTVNGEPKEVRGLAVSRSAVRFNMSTPLPASEFEASSTNNIKAKTEDKDFVMYLNGLSESLKTINGCKKQKPMSEMAVAPIDAKAPEIANLDAPKTKEISEIAVEDVDQAQVKPEEGAETADIDDSTESTENSEDSNVAENTEVASLAEEPIVEEERHPLYPMIPVVNVRSVNKVEANAPRITPAIPIGNMDLNEAIRADKIEMGDNVDVAPFADSMDMRNKAKSTVTTDPLPGVAEGVGAPEFHWVANKGERLSEVLSRWGDDAGVKIKWQADDDPKLITNLATDAPFDQAVSILMDSVSSTEGDVFQAAMRKSDNVAENLEAEFVEDWRALHGMDIRSVLENWTEKAGIDLLWEAQGSFNVQEEYKKQASFAQAVTDLLEQFKGFAGRPVAQLNEDPVTGRVTLIIQDQPINSGS